MTQQTDPETVRSELAKLLEDVAHSDDLVYTYQQIGGCYLRLGKFHDAEEAHRLALELDPFDAFTHFYLGNLAYAQREYVTAIEWFTRGIELCPDEAVGYWCLGDAHNKMGEDEKAGEYYERACQVDPEDEAARERFETWQHEQQRERLYDAIDEAYNNDHAATTVLLAERYLADYPPNIFILSCYVDMLYQMTRYDEAIRVIENAIARARSDRRWALYLKMGDLYRYRGDFPGAEPWYQKAIEDRSDDATGYIFLGSVLARQGKLKAAEEAHRRGTLCTKGCVYEAFHNLGLVLRGQGRLAEAAEAFRRAIELCSDYPEAIGALEDVEKAIAFSEDETF